MNEIRVDLAFLAEYASVHPDDGRLSVIGGGLRELALPTFPATRARLSLAVGVEIPSAERGHSHRIVFDAAPPPSVDSKELVAKASEVTFTLPSEEGDADGYLHFVSQMDNVTFAAPGRYRFSVTIDDIHLRDVFLDVKQEGDESNPDALLLTGYRAYAEGRLDEAEQVFRDVIDRYPAVAGGYNNFGFVQIARGNGREALDAFIKASELNYAYPEINVANIATALFATGDYTDALRLFETCHDRMVFRSTGMLYALSDDKPFPVPLPSAADYAALMALNSGWSALRAGDKDRASMYLEEVKASALARDDDPRATAVRSSMSSLRAALT